MQLSSQNISDYKDVFIAEWLEGDGIFVQTYQFQSSSSN
ncbi:membrane protein [Peribacillus asahii]|uniref:Membrane protein n=1 Tax=Peribacillus asahii TaxID=228899 RepID=A0A3T0KQK6_9BACI|nr:membrane protein [Peribacillus asahii]